MKQIIKKGDKFGRLTAVRFNHKDKWYYHHWLFKCECGNKKIISVQNVISGYTKACGCLRSELLRKRNTIHKMTGTITYKSWQGMKDRCLNKNNPEYKNYGGRGITICKDWLNFENFYADMKERPENKSIDRINNNGNYCKSNCQWATRQEQCNNRRTNHFLTHNGKTQTISQWARELGIGKHTLRTRIDKLNWTIERALTTH